MSDLKLYKEIGSVPDDLGPDSIYAIRTGSGFDLYMTDTTGSVAYKINGTSISSNEDNLIEMSTDGLLVKIKEASEETSASVKEKYESNPNTNAFTDKHKTTLEALQGLAPADSIESFLDAFNSAMSGSA